MAILLKGLGCGTCIDSLSHMNVEFKLFFRSVAILFLILHLAYRLSMWRKYSFLAVMTEGSLGKMLVVWWCTYQFLLMKTCSKPYPSLKRSGMPVPTLVNVECEAASYFYFFKIHFLCAFVYFNDWIWVSIGFSFYAIDCGKAWRSGHVEFTRCYFSLFDWIISTSSIVVFRSSHDPCGWISWKYRSPQRMHEKHIFVISTSYFLQH